MSGEAEEEEEEEEARGLCLRYLGKPAAGVFREALQGFSSLPRAVLSNCCLIKYIKTQ